MDEHEGEVKSHHRDAHHEPDASKHKSKKSRSIITLPREQDADAEEDSLLHAEYTMSSREKFIFSVFFILHVIFFEYPLLCIEGALRTIVLVTITICVCILRIFSSEYQMWPFIRETLRTAAISLTIAIPGGALLPYRRFRFDDSWDLSPLPTMVGYVDCRRFLTITLGQGHTASNRYCRNSKECDDSWKGPVLLFPLDIVYTIRQFSFRYRTQELPTSDSIHL